MRGASPSAHTASAWRSGPRLRGRDAVGCERAWDPGRCPPAESSKAPWSPPGLGYIPTRSQLWGPHLTPAPEVPFGHPPTPLSFQGSTIKTQCVGFHAFPDPGVLTSFQLPAS